MDHSLIIFNSKIFRMPIRKFLRKKRSSYFLTRCEKMRRLLLNVYFLFSLHIWKTKVMSSRFHIHGYSKHEIIFHSPHSRCVFVLSDGNATVGKYKSWRLDALPFLRSVFVVTEIYSVAFNDAFAYVLSLTCNETSSKLEVLEGSYINDLYALPFVPLCCEKINVLWVIYVPLCTYKRIHCKY